VAPREALEEPSCQQSVFGRPRPVAVHRGVGKKLAFAAILSARNDRALLVNSVSPNTYQSVVISHDAIARSSRLELSAEANPGSPDQKTVAAERGPSDINAWRAQVRQPAHDQETARKCCRDLRRGARAGGRLYVRDLWFLRREPAVSISSLRHDARPRDWHPVPNDGGPSRQGLQAVCPQRYPADDLL
jgi:hypothetical protein